MINELIYHRFYLYIVCFISGLIIGVGLRARECACVRMCVRACVCVVQVHFTLRNVINEGLDGVL